MLLTPFGRLRVGSAIGIIESLSPNGADPQDIEDRQLAHRVELSVSSSGVLSSELRGLIGIVEPISDPSIHPMCYRELI